jgi:hypothetical protein
LSVQKRTVILAGPVQRATAHRYVDDSPIGYVITFSEATKKRIQEEKYHAQIGDIARQTDYAGKRWDADDMKRILIDEFADDMRNAGTPLHNDGRLIPSENGRRVIQLGIQSREFYVKEASQFIEFLFAWGADRSVEWTDPAMQRPEAAAA